MVSGSWPKKIRTKNPSIIEEFSMLLCNACGSSALNDVHHIKTKGSGGPDENWNLMTLCRECHTAWHQLGAFGFAEKKPRIRIFLKMKGWEFDGRKLRRREIHSES